MFSLSSYSFYLRLAWLFTFICFFICMACRYRPLNKRGGIGQPLPNPIGFIFTLIAYVPFAGLRTEIGDTFFYMHDFELAEPDGKINFEFGGDSLYPFLSEVVKETSNDFHDVTLITSIVSLVPVLYIIYKYSHPYELAVYLFMATGYFGLSMNGLRQYAATGILMLGTKYFFSEKKTAFLRYGVIVLLAWMMHESAPMMIFTFFFVRRKTWSASTFLLILVTIVGTSIFDLILPSFLSGLEHTAYDNYAENGWFTDGGEGGSNFVRVFVAMVPIVIAYFSRARMRKLGRVNDILTNLGFVHMALYIVSSYNWIFARFAIYTSVYYIIFLAWVVYNGVSKKDKGLYYTLCMIFYYWYSTYQSYAIENYVSDRFFPNRKIF